MIERICDDKLTRVNRTGFKDNWSYCGERENKKPQTVMWQYHSNAQNYDNKQRKCVDNAPANQQISPSSTTSVGSDAEPNYVLTPSRYWPYTRWILESVNCDKWLSHPSGGRQSCKWWPFKAPLTPKVELSRDSTVLTFNVDSHASDMGSTSEYDRSQTRWWKQVISSGSFPEPDPYGQGGHSGTFTDETFETTYDCETLSPESPVAVRVCAVNDGMAGPSAVGSAYHVFARPNKPTVSLSASDSGVLAGVTTNADWWHPIDKLVLQRQVSPVRNDAGSWTNVQTLAAGAASAKTMMDALEARIPAEDNASWYRVMVFHDDESNASYGYAPKAALMGKPKAPTISGSFNADGTITATVSIESQMEVKTYVQVMSGSVAFTGWVQVTAGTNVLRPTEGLFDAAYSYQLMCKNVSVEAPLDGQTRESATTVSEDVASDTQASVAGARLSAVTIDELTSSATGDGLELTWSWDSEDVSGIDYADKGTLIEWTSAPGGWDSTTKPSSYKSADGTGTHGFVTIDGLDEGVTYRVRVSRYITVSGTDGTGPAASATATPWSTPDTPMLLAPVSVAAGEGIEYSWTFADAGDTPQTEARLHVAGEVILIEGTSGSYVLATAEEDAGEVVSAWVEVSCGGGWSEASAAVSTYVAARPTCTISPAGALVAAHDFGGYTLGALPLKLTLTGSADRYRVVVRAATQARPARPAGARTVSVDEVVAWATADAAGVFEVPSELIFGGGAYTVEVIPYDTATGLAGPSQTLSFGVAWAEPAVLPTAEITIADGQALITPIQGVGARTDEVCRIWRVSADGPMCVLEDGQWGVTYVDEVPPYGSDERSYLVEALTPDGDSRWNAVAYELLGGTTRVVWSEGTVELPFDLALSASWNTSFERRTHLDGTRAGYFGSGADCDYSASGLLPTDDDRLEAVRALARWDGPAFVRAAGGVAFAASVDVRIDVAQGSHVATVDLTARVIDDAHTWDMVAESEEV